jgi:hypothetical protein
MTALQVLCRMLVDDTALREASQDVGAQRRLWDLAFDHYAHLCLAWRLTAGAGASWDDAVLKDARSELAHAAVLEDVQRRELLAVTRALAEAGIEALLLKGAALAYQVYPEPALRPRDDTDLLIRTADRDRAGSALIALGYEPAAENTSELATAQRHLVRVDAQGFAHSIDVHWRVTNPLVFAEALPFDRAWRRSVAVPALEGARALCFVDALLLAGLHRLAHHGDDSSLIWVYDIHRLAGAFAEQDWEDLVAQAAANSLSGACRHGLSRSREAFGTRIPAGILEALEANARPSEEEFFQPRVSPLRVLVSDWRALDSWSGRVRLLGAHVFPEPAYMATKYGTRNPVLLPFLYAHRALTGLPKWLARSPRT